MPHGKKNGRKKKMKKTRSAEDILRMPGNRNARKQMLALEREERRSRRRTR